MKNVIATILVLTLLLGGWNVVRAQSFGGGFAGGAAALWTVLSDGVVGLVGNFTQIGNSSNRYDIFADTLDANILTVGSTVSGDLDMDFNSITNALSITASNTTATNSAAFTFLTQGSVPFIGAAGALSEDNANFFWDDTNNRFGIGTTTPSSRVQISDSDGSSSTASSRTILVTNGANGRFAIGTTAYGASSPNAVEFETFNSLDLVLAPAATEVVRITDGARVGIGTSTPGVKLQVATNDSDKLFLTDSTDPLKQLRLGYNSSGNYGTIQAIQSGTAFRDLILNGDGGNVGIGTTSPGYLLDVDGDFRVGEAGSSRALFVDATNGRVGIGHTGNPSFELDVVGSSRFGLNEDLTPDGTGLVGQVLLDGNGYAGVIAMDASGMYFGHNSAARKLFLQTDETNRLTIDGSGNVGIGTDAPVETLDVVHATDAKISVRATSGGGKMIIRAFQGSLGQFGSENNIPIELITNNTARLHIDTSGNVGFGTTTPQVRLDVTRGGALYPTSISAGTAAIFSGTSNQSGVNGIAILAGDATEAYINFGDQGAEAQGRIIYNNSTDALGFRTNGGSTNELTIASSGNVGIGTTSPYANLAVVGTSTQDTAFVITSDTGSPLLTIQNDNDTVFGDGIETIGFVDYAFSGTDGTNILGIVTDAGNARHVFGTDGSGNAVWRSFNEKNLLFAVESLTGATLAFNNDLTPIFGVGTTTPYAQLSVDGSGAGAGIPLLAIATSTTNALFIDETGLVGIGTTSPTSLLTVHGASPSIDVYDTDTDELRKFTGALEKSFTYATTSAWTGTTTIPFAPAWEAQTFSGAKCFTDAGTLNVSLNDGTNRANLINASTTVGTNTYTTNNTFTASEKRYVDIGTPASSPTEISCTFRYYEN